MFKTVVNLMEFKNNFLSANRLESNQNIFSELECCTTMRPVNSLLYQK